TPLTSRWGNQAPRWTPDGRRIVFSSNREGGTKLFWQPADGSGPAERLTTSGDDDQWPGSWSPDGKVLFLEDGPRIAILEPNGDRKPRPFASGPGTAWVNWPRLSPNGRWLAYESDESGRNEVYVRPFPGSGSRWTVSKDGGDQPVWARNGR